MNKPNITAEGCNDEMKTLGEWKRKCKSFVAVFL